MSTSVLVKRCENEWVISCEALRGRIDRHLRKLVPYREFIYDHSTGGFYVRIVSGGTAQHMTRQGPYYYQDFSGLARMLGLFHLKNGLDLPPVTAIDRKGGEHPEKALSNHLQFEVITEALSAMIKQIEDAGHKVIIDGNKAIIRHDVTTTVTEELNPGFEDYVELTEEEERALSGKA